MQQYARQIINPISRMKTLWKSFGAHVVQGATTEKLCRTVHEVANENGALFLITHWMNGPPDRIELFDGMVNIECVAEMFPVGFCGVVDLSICQSLALAKRLKSRCPQATVKWVNTHATPAVWLNVLTMTLRLMHGSNIQYLDAVEIAMRSLQNAHETQP